MTKLSTSDFYAMTVAMQTRGGSFVAALGQALRYADPTNRQRILDAFPEFVEQYAPKAEFIEA